MRKRRTPCAGHRPIVLVLRCGAEAPSEVAGRQAHLVGSGKLRQNIRGPSGAGYPLVPLIHCRAAALGFMWLRLMYAMRATIVASERPARPQPEHLLNEGELPLIRGLGVVVSKAIIQISYCSGLWNTLSTSATNRTNEPLDSVDMCLTMSSIARCCSPRLGCHSDSVMSPGRSVGRQFRAWRRT